MASVIEDLNDISKDLAALRDQLEGIFEKTDLLIDFLDEQINRLVED